MRRSNAPTLQDVARDAGVATITVSVVLNGSRSATRVSDSTRARIVEAAKRLNYRPNGAARGLSRRRMDNIGVVGLIESNAVNLYFLDVLTGILSSAAKHKQNTTILSVTDWVTDENKVLQFCDGRVDGIILVGPSHMTSEFAERLLKHAPYVMIHGNEAPLYTDDLDIDNEAGAYAATNHLISMGHRRIVHFAGPMHFVGPRQRLAGYRRALEEASIGYDSSLVLHGDFSTKSGTERAVVLLKMLEDHDRPTAVFSVNDAVAVGCIEELSKHGVDVPKDISIVGFDDGAIAKMVKPQLTTVRQPLYEMGQYAVDRLMFRIEESLSKDRTSKLIAAIDEDAVQSFAKPHMEIFPYEMVIRASTAPPYYSV